MRLIQPESLSEQTLAQLPLFFKPGWFRYQENNLVRCFLYQDDGGVLIPFRVYTRSIFRTGQFLYKPWHPDGPLSGEQEKLAIERFSQFVKKNRICDFLRAPIHVCLFKDVPAGAQAQKMGIISVDLARPEEAVFADFSKTYRTQIRQCEKAGFRISTDSMHLLTFFENYKIHHQRQHKTFESLSAIQRLLNLMPENAVLFSVINPQGIWEGGVMLIYDSFRGYYLLGAKHENSELHQGSQKYLHYSIMKFLMQKNVKRYNLGGYHFSETTDPKFDSIQNFKLKFGAETEVGLLFDIPIHFKHTLYQWLIRVKSLIK